MLKNIMQINSDADGVCLDFSSGFHHFMLSEFGLITSSQEPINFNYSDCYPTVNSLMPMIKDFVNSRDYFSQIKAYPCALEAFKKYKSDIGGNIRIITSCGTSTETKEARELCIEREFPGLISDIIFCDFGACKSDVVNSLPGSIFMDDLADVCSKVRSKSDHSVFLINRKYNEKTNQNNQTDPSINRINSPLDLPIF
tara:strand:- start:559 stop:1152 length:594 start_codon:yes stop_codon:yes gene_type:complete